MKFPYELSKERLSLLTEKDRAIYEYEHSGLSPEMKKLEELNYNINLYNSLYNNINENIDDSNISESLFNSQFDELFDKELINEVGYEEYINIKKQIFEYIQNDHELKPLYEAPGEPTDWWLTNIKLGWLGKLAAGLLTGLLGTVAWLMMKGKDRLAMKKLKQYMNKLVELVDQGVNKKKPWYAFLIPTKKGQQNTGDYNRSCFRTIQETAERNMACLYTSCIHDLGFLSPDITNFKSLVGEKTAQEGSGLSIFEEKANSLNDILGTLVVPKDNGDKNKLLPFELDKSLFKSVKLPAVPTNYNMLMSDIDYPSKAKQNPNGSLFMKPTQEILQAKQSDIAQAYFRDASIENIVNKKSIQQKQEESILYTYFNNLYEAGILTSDLTGDIAGKEIKQDTLDREETKVQPFNGKITEAIDGYCRSAISIVNKLVKAICGKSSGQQMSKLNKTIAQLINAAEGHMSDFMKKEDSVLSKIISDSQEKTFRQLQDHIEATQRIGDIQTWLNTDKSLKGDFTVALMGTDDKEKQNIKISKLLKLINDKSINNKWLDIELNNLFNKNYSEILKLARDKGVKTLGDSVNYNFYNSININEADEQHMDDTIANTNNMVLDNLHKTMDTTFNTVRNKLTEELAEMLPTNTDDWYIITNSRERMKALKEAADKEINAKIELICRTASTTNSDMGGKFKAAISKHPMRAESLKGIWSRYSDDLNDRMESRLRSITGDNGNSNILQTIEQFLTTTFPNLMAIMLQYKGLFYLVTLYTRNHPIDVQMDEVNIANENSKLTSQVLALEYFDDDND